MSTDKPTIVIPNGISTDEIRRVEALRQAVAASQKFESSNADTVLAAAQKFESYLKGI